MNRTKRLALTLLVACGLAVAWWLGLRFQQRTALKELELLGEQNMRIAEETSAKKNRERAAQAQMVAEGERSPDERRRRRVMSVMAQIEKERGGVAFVPPPRSPSGPGGSIFPELMDDPEYTRLTQITQKFSWVKNYGRWFQWAKVPKEKQERLSELMQDMNFSRYEFLAVARKNGLIEKQGWELSSKYNSGLFAEIKQLIGPDAYGLLFESDYRIKASGANDLVRYFETRLSYSDTPLSKEQAEQVFAAAIETKVDYLLKPEQIEPLIERARLALTPAQLEAFRQVVTEHNYGKSQSTSVVNVPKK